MGYLPYQLVQDFFHQQYKGIPPYMALIQVGSPFQQLQGGPFFAWIQVLQVKDLYIMPRWHDDMGLNSWIYVVFVQVTS